MYGCKAEPPLLLPPADWELAAQEFDPAPEHRPVDGECPDGSWYEEQDSLEVDTELCTYALLTQDLGADIHASQSWELSLWHARLWAPEATQAHAMLVVDDEIIFELLVEIPAQTDIYPMSGSFSDEHDALAPVVLHLHNHGANTWKLSGLKSGP